MGRAAGFQPYTAHYWNEEAREWDQVIEIPTNPHQFYYFEADVLISRALTRGMRALELGCGTGGSTLVHAREVPRLTATDFSSEMVRLAAKKLRREQGSSVDFSICDACNLPFRVSSFDAVISRGVLLSYVADPKGMFSELHRVLRPTGLIAVDAMNWIRGRTRTISRGFRMTKDGPAYTEFFVSSGRQIRHIYILREDSPYTALANECRSCAERPKDLRKYAVSTTKYEARLFTRRGLKALAEDTGFTDVKIAPLGQLTYALGSEDKTLRDFVVANRHQLSRLMLLLGSHLCPESALHSFITARKG